MPAGSSGCGGPSARDDFRGPSPVYVFLAAERLRGKGEVGIGHGRGDVRRFHRPRRAARAELRKESDALLAVAEGARREPGRRGCGRLHVIAEGLLSGDGLRLAERPAVLVGMIDERLLHAHGEVLVQRRAGARDREALRGATAGEAVEGSLRQAEERDRRRLAADVAAEVEARARGLEVPRLLAGERVGATAARRDLVRDLVLADLRGGEEAGKLWLISAGGGRGRSGRGSPGRSRGCGGRGRAGCAGRRRAAAA